MSPRRGDSERGAVVAEATIALAVFIFAIFTLLSLVNMCYIQSKIGSSLAESAKEISQYAFLYYKFSIDKAQAKLNAENAESRATATQTIDGVGTVLDALSDSKDSLGAGSFREIADSAGTAGTEVKSIFTMYKDELKDPKTFLIGMAKLAGEEVLETGKNKLGQLMALAFTQKNLIESPKDDADKFLRRYKIKDGLDGLNFDGSTLMAYGKSDEIQLVVTYDIEVIKLLNIDFSFTVTQCAKTEAWGGGVSAARIARAKLGTGANVWDLTPLERGKTITDMEKNKFRYTSEDRGFDAFEPTGNRFIQITSMYGETYKTASGIRSKLYSTLSDMSKKVAKVDEDVTVKDSTESGKEKTLKSPVSTRTYKIILVVPDNADLATIKSAAEAFEREKRASGETVEVEVRTGYGSPTEKPDETESETESAAGTPPEGEAAA
ncbi:MAG: hypothetical protein LBD49_00700 [Oscillospiraceae bacterium]|nr:hypothetical protein [Oscillospiraceae bacterium]